VTRPVPLLGALLLAACCATPALSAPRHRTHNDPGAIEALKRHIPQPSCADEAVRIRRAETELPKLEAAPPEDHQIVCITLETNLLFARRLDAHLKACPKSSYAEKAERWTQTQARYAAQFRERRCKQTIKEYRG
jgi:hypothetical protein